jgi:uncharacterized protein (DUF58 family)
MRERGRTSLHHRPPTRRGGLGATRRLGFAVVALVVCLLLSLRAEHAYVAACGALALILIGIGYPVVLARLGGVSVGAVRDRVRVGEPVTLSVRSVGPVTLHGLRVDAGPQFEAPQDLTLARGRGAHVNLMACRRGVFELSSVDVSTAYPLGLFRARVRSDAHGSVIVWPVSIAAEMPASAAVTQADLSDETGSTRSGNDDFIGLRSYRRGDSLRLVHWQQSARYDRLIVRQRAGTSRLVARITLDTRSTVHAGDPDAFERCVSVTAGLIEQAIARQMTVTLVIGGERTAVRHADDLAIALDRLAVAGVDGNTMPAAQGVLVTTTHGAATAGPGWACVCVDQLETIADHSGVAA